MESTLELYHRPYDRREPVVCMDETTKQLTAEVIEPLAAAPGRPERFDTLYRRNGVATLFMHFQPPTDDFRVQIILKLFRVE